MTVGSRIKNRRKELGISADSLASVLGVSRSTIFRYESGYIEKFPVDSLEPIASALNTSVRYLMGWDDSEDNDSYQKAFDLSDSEIVVLKKYRELNDVNKGKIEERLDMLLDDQTKEAAKSLSSAG